MHEGTHSRLSEAPWNHLNIRAMHGTAWNCSGLLCHRRKPWHRNKMSLVYIDQTGTPGDTAKGSLHTPYPSLSLSSQKPTHNLKLHLSHCSSGTNAAARPLLPREPAWLVFASQHAACFSPSSGGKAWWGHLYMLNCPAGPQGPVSFISMLTAGLKPPD